MTKSGLKLNLGKCIWCLVSARGIEANPEKIVAIMNMRPPATRKQVQKLMGRLAAVNRFIARSAEKGLPFFRILRNTEHFEWGPE